MSTDSDNDSDTQVCIDSSKPGYGCRRTFDQKTTAGLCARCQYLGTLNGDSEDYKKMAAAPTCMGCGAIVMFMAPGTSYCGMCEKKINAQCSTAKSAKELQQAKYTARAEAMANRTLPKKHLAVHSRPGAHVAAGAIGGRSIKIFLNPIAPRTAISSKLFIASNTFSETDSFPECITQLLAQWNVPWEKESTESLAIEHISLRHFGNLAIKPGSDLQTVGHFLDTHESMLPVDPKKRAPTVVQTDKSPFIYLEGVINVNEFESKTQVEAPYWAHTDKELKKRKKRLSIVSDYESLQSKRLKSASTVKLQSTWVPRIPMGMTEVKLLYATIHPAEDSDSSNDYELRWPEDASVAVTGYLADEELDHGATKMVYRLLVDNKLYAAKRFSNTGNVDETVSLEDNLREVTYEAFRLTQLKKLLDEFKSHAKKHKISIAADLKVTDFHVAREIIGKDSKPSPASGHTSQHLESLQAQDRSIVWLIEPMRPKVAAEKWSGTMQHPAHSSKLGVTLTSFVHFAFEWTKKTLVFADLETMASGSGGKPSSILFDVMSHTLAGDSGVGDFGCEGIQQFVDDHKCDKKCRDLGLQPLKEGEGDKSGDESEDPDRE